MIASILAVAAISVSQGEPIKPSSVDMSKMRTIQFAVLVDGPTHEQRSPEATQKLQKEHLDGLEKLWSEGKALAVGPVGKAKPWRGLCILDVKTPEEAKSLLAGDPWVKNGEMAIECYSWYCDASVFKKGRKFLDIAPHFLGVLVRVKDAPKITDAEANQIQAGHLANIQRMWQMGICKSAGPLLNGGDMRGLLFFMDATEDQIKAEVAKDPAVVGKRLELKLFPWFTAKGTFEPGKPKP